jgi:quercetin dioxygenase-like cupin family protein
MIHGALYGESLERPAPGVTRLGFNTEKVSVVRYWFEPGASFPRHSHPEEQVTIVEAGRLTFYSEGEECHLTVGEWVVARPGAEHGVVASKQGATFLCVLSPARASAP